MDGSLLKQLSDGLKKEIDGRKIKQESDAAQVRREVLAILQPVLTQLALSAQLNKQDFIEIAKHIQVNIPEIKIPEVNANVQIPQIKSPEVFVPRPQVTVNVPEVKVPPITIPQLQWPDGGFPIKGGVKLVDKFGKDIDIFENMKQLVSGQPAGGKADYFTIKGYSASAFSELLNPDGRVKVELPTGSSGLTDSELRAIAVPVSQVSGAIWSTAVIDIFGSTAASDMINPDNRLKVSVETGGSGLTDSELRASAVPVSQVSGSEWSTSASQAGTWNIATLTGITNTLAVANIDSSGIQYSGSNPMPITGTVVVSSVTATTGSAIIDSTGIQYSGSNPVPITIISGALTSVIAVGDIASDVQDTGSAPLKIGGIARTANPTAVAAGDRVSATFDDLGRQLIRPVQVRDLITTARAQLTNGTEATLVAAVAGSYLDCIAIMCANNSDAAVSVDIRAVTAGNIVQTIQVPASGTAGWAPPIPWPQDATGNNWTADMSDITGTTVSISALFSKEI